MHTQHMWVSKIAPWVIPILFAIIPVFFLPLTQDFYDTNKWTLLMGATLVLILFEAWNFIHAPHIPYFFRPVTISLGLITATSMISLFVASTNKTEGILSTFGPATFVALTLLSLMASRFWDNTVSRRFLWAIFCATTFLGLVAVYQFAGVGKFMFPSVQYLTDPLWTPTGSSVATVALFLIVSPLLISGLFETHRHQKEGQFVVLLIMVVMIFIGLGLTLWQLIPLLPITLLSPRDGWMIMLEILKTPRQALVGVGAENFLTAFTAGRPVQMNMTPLWNTRFLSNANVLFHLTTIYGLIGAVGTLMFFKLLVFRKQKDALFISLILSVLALLLTPPNLSLLVIITGILLVAHPNHASEVSHRTHPHSSSRWILSIFCIALCGIAGFGLIRSYTSDILFTKSLIAAGNRNGTETYNLQSRAIKLNPNVSRFHIVYSQTNLALATSLAQEITSDTATTADDQTKNRELIAQLVQQAIREAKIAVNLNSSSVLAWENLARTYNSLIGVAQGADTWAASTFNRTLLLDPVNASLAVELGGVYVKMKNYTQAITHFQRATSLKPDYANAWYNLANVYQLTGNETLRVQALERAQSLLESDSSDYQIINNELLEARNPATGNDITREAAEQLATPTPVISIDPPIEIPE